MKHATDSKAPATTTHAATAAADAKPVDLHLATTPREEAAYEQMLPLARALDRSELLQMNLDMPTAASTCVAVARRMMQFRPFFATLPSFDVKALDLLEPAGLALAVAQADFKAAVTPPDSLSELVERGTIVRASLQAWGDALANGGLVSHVTAEALRGGTSTRELAIALTSWVRTYRGADWGKIKAASLLTDALLDEAEALSQRILAVIGYRDLNPEKISAAQDLRQRMFTLAVGFYDEVRRGAMFMRWKFDDVDDFVPSLYAKGPRKPEHSAVIPAQSPAAHDDHASSSSSSSSSPSSPAASAAPATHATAPAAAETQEVGLPNSSPFTHGG